MHFLKCINYNSVTEEAWSKFAEKNPEYAQELNDIIEHKTRGITASEEYQAALDRLSQKSQNALYQATPEAEFARKAAAELAAQFRASRDKAGADITDEQINFQSMVYGHYLLASAERFGVDIEEFHRANFEQAWNSQEAEIITETDEDGNQRRVEYVTITDEDGNQQRVERNGGVQFNVFQHSAASIHLSPTANASTFLHELSHIALDDLLTFGRYDTANDEVKGDLEIVMNYLGITDADIEELNEAKRTRHDSDEAEERYQAINAKITEAHELWARTGEDYFKLGIAPNVELQGVFSRIRNWMLEIYKGIKSIAGVDIPWEVKEVFDRMLAFDTDLENATISQLMLEEALLGERIKSLEQASGQVNQDTGKFISQELTDYFNSMFNQTAFYGTPDDELGVGSKQLAAHGWGVNLTASQEAAERNRTAGVIDKVFTGKRGKSKGVVVDGKRYTYDAATKTWSDGKKPLTSYRGNVLSRIAAEPDISSAINFLNHEIKRLQQAAKDGSSIDNEELKALKWAKGEIVGMETDAAAPKGSLFVVDAPENNVLLDWDKGISGQPEAVINALNKLKAKLKNIDTSFFDDFDAGQTFYELLGETLAPNAAWEIQARAASDMLNRYGIPGLTYAADNTRVFTIWNEGQLKLMGVDSPVTGMGAEASKKFIRDVTAWAKKVVTELKEAKNAALYVIKTPAVFQFSNMFKAGSRPLDLVLNAQKISELGNFNHPEVADRILKQLPRALTDPIAIFKSEPLKMYNGKIKQRNDSIVVMTDLKGKVRNIDTGKTGMATIIASVQLNNADLGYDVNKITSVYGKTYGKSTKNGDKAGLPMNQWFIDQIEKGNLLYINRGKFLQWYKETGFFEQLSEADKKEFSQWVNPTGLDLPAALTAGKTNVIVPDERNLVKFFEQDEAFYQATNASTEQDSSFLTQEKYDAIMRSIFDQTAYHGTRHNLGGGFDLRYIGTGEVSRVYGWGIYLAESRNVAEIYRESGKFNNLVIYFPNGEKYKRRKFRDWDAPNYLYKQVFNHIFGILANKKASTFEEARNILRNKYQEELKNAKEKLSHGLKEGNNATAIHIWDKAVKERQVAIFILNSISKVSPNSISLGNIYTVDVPENDVLLDWDKSFKENPIKVIEAINQLVEDKDINIDNEMTGANIYRALSRLLGSDKAASEILNKYGIPGLRYWDRMSRNEGDGTHNFVIWNTDLLKIIGVEGDASEFETYNQTARADDIVPEEQVDAVRKRYEGTAQWLKAPNGKQSNLDERAWLQVRTPAFKKWFGDWENKPEEASKALDDNGEPLVVYHGVERGGFNVFSTGGKGEASGTGAWFTSSRENASTYSGTLDVMKPRYVDGWASAGLGESNYAVFLNLRNPYIFDAQGRNYDSLGDIYISDTEEGERIYEKSNGNLFLNEADARNYIKRKFKDKKYERYKVFSDYVTTNHIAAAVRRGDYGKNYDGVIFKNIQDTGPLGNGDNYKATDYVIFNPEQVKSIDNTGTFDPNNPNIFYQIGQRRKDNMDKALQANRTDLTAEQRADVISEIEKLGEQAKAGGNPKVEKAATHWVLGGHIILPEDNYKILDAIKICEQQHIDPMTFADPNEILAKYTIKESKADKRVNPDTVREFSNKQELPHGITVYTVQDDEAGQAAVRNIIDTHWGEDANPWCLAAWHNGSLDGDAWYRWEYYNAIPKRIAFKDGKLLAFSANSNKNIKWWDREDSPSDGIPFTVKENGDVFTYIYDEENGDSVKSFGILKDGTRCEFHKNGQMSIAYLPDGTKRMWHENGQMSYEKLPDKTERVWYENGQLSYEALPDGTYCKWYENGQMSFRDFIDGTQCGWYETGEKRLERTLDGTVYQWYKSGQKEYEKLPDGTQRWYREDGTLIEEYSPKNSDNFNQIIGKNGAYRLDALDEQREARQRLNALEQARQMEITGAHPKRIKLRTGWERGVDGKWRYEILDGNLILKNIVKDKRLKLPDVYNNPELYKAYPALKNTIVVFTSLDKSIGGSYNANTNTIKENIDRPLSKWRSGIVHEIQHAIQYLEGFAYGMGITEKELNTPKYDRYMRAAGEVEARNAQKRIDWDMDKRWRTLIDDTDRNDVRRNRQIIMLNGREVYNPIYDEVTQLNQTKTPEFKAFFGDWENEPKNASKVVDEDGKPLLVWHGTEQGGFSEFRTGGKLVAKGTGAWFTSSRENASTYSGTTATLETYEEDSEVHAEGGASNYPVFLNIRKPYIVEGDGRFWSNLGDLHIYDEETDTVITKKSDNTYFINKGDAYDYIEVELGDKHHDRYSIRGNEVSTNKIAADVRNGKYGNDYDGVIFKNIIDFGGTGYNGASDVFVAFNPNQIKSATDNVGTFDPNNPNIFYQIGQRRKADMDKALQANRTDLTAEQRADVISEIEKLGEQVKAGGNSKVEKAATHWVLGGHIILPEDNYKILDAIKICEQQHIDPMSFSDPNEILAKYTIKESKADKRVNPDTVREFSNKQELPHGITVYTVQDDKAGQAAVRNIIDTHWGEDANPWCLAARVDGELDTAWNYWHNTYTAIPKRIAFKDGKLLAFSASDNDTLWWDREDTPSTGIPFTIKENGDTISYGYNEETGELQKLREKLADGTEREWWYDIGQIREERLPDETLRGWYRNGQMAFEHLPDGRQRDWFEDGHLRHIRLLDGTERNWYNIDPLQITNDTHQIWYEHLPDGTERWWYRNGQMRSETLPDGTLRQWDEDGTLVYEFVPQTPDDLLEAALRGTDTFNQIGKQRKVEMNDALKERRPNMTEEERTATIAEIEKLGERVRKGGSPKVEKAAVNWVLNGHIVLPKDNDKIWDAMRVCEQKHLNPLDYNDPNDILVEYKYRLQPDNMRTDPDKVAEFSDKQVLPNGIVTYAVEDSKAGQAAVREVIDTNWGKDANPWCLAARKNGSLDRAWEYWNSYDAYEKRIAFLDGHLLAFSANSDERVRWWDKWDDYSGLTSKVIMNEPGLNFSNGKVRWFRKEGTKDVLNVKFDIRNGMATKYFKDGTSFTGKIISIYNNHMPRVMVNEKTIKKHGKEVAERTILDLYDTGEPMTMLWPDGAERGWYDNGQIDHEYLSDGTKRYWNIDGQIAAETLPDGTKRWWYENGQMGHEHLPDGTDRDWYYNGQISYEKLPDGTKRSWYNDGRLEYMVLPDGTILDGSEVDADTFNQTAQPAAEASLAADERAWGELIDRFKTGKLTKEERSGLLPVMQTPLVFKLVGMDLLPVEIRLDNLNKILNKKHKLSAETLKQIPRAITDPIMIFKSEHDVAGERDSRVILTGLKEAGKDGIERNVVAAIRLSRKNISKGYEINELTTVYRKDTSSKQQLTPEQDIIDWISKTYKDGTPMDLLMYINKEKASKWSVSEGLSPIEFDTNGSLLKNIPDETDLVKLRQENETFYQVIGTQGAARLDESDKRNRIEHLNTARAMEAAGKPAEKIKYATGWERGVDGKWRYEIPDGKLKKHDWHDGDETTLGKLYSNPKLYKAYPDLKDLPVRFKADYRGEYTAFTSGDGKYIQINAFYLDGLDAGSIIHEIQHLIQDREGFANGGNPLQAHKGKAKEYMDREFARALEYIHFLNYEGFIQKYYKDYKGKDTAEARNDYEKYKEYMYMRAEHAASFNFYRNLAGEVEARNADRRAGMKAAERRKSLLSGTEDISREDQIILFANNYDTFNQISKNRRANMDALLKKNRKDLSPEERAELISEIEKLGEANIPNGSKKKYNPELEAAVLHWTMNDKYGNITLPKSSHRIIQALKLCKKLNIPVEEVKDMNAFLDEHTTELKSVEERINPDTVKEFSRKQVMPNGITVYTVEDSEAGQKAVRRIVDTHWGINSQPWCITETDDNGNLTSDALYYWKEKYNATDKKIAFKDGKLLAFSANQTSDIIWTDRLNREHKSIPGTETTADDIFADEGSLGQDSTVSAEDTAAAFDIFADDLFEGQPDNKGQPTDNLDDLFIDTFNQAADLPFEDDEYLSPDAVKDVDGWLQWNDEYQNKLNLYKSERAAFKAIRELGGIRYQDLVDALGEALAKDLRSAFPTLFRKSGGQEQLPVDVLLQNLNEHTELQIPQFEYVDDFIDWLYKTSLERPKRPAPIVEINPDTEDALISRLGLEGAREYTKVRRDYLNKLQKRIQAEYDRDKSNEKVRGDLEATYLEQQEIDKFLGELREIEKQAKNEAEADRKAGMSDEQLEMERRYWAIWDDLRNERAANTRHENVHQAAKRENISIEEAFKRGYAMAEKYSKQAYEAGLKEGKAQQREKYKKLKELSDEKDALIGEIKHAMRDKGVIWNTQQRIKKLIRDYNSKKDKKMADLRALHEQVIELQTQGCQELDVKNNAIIEHARKISDELASTMADKKKDWDKGKVGKVKERINAAILGAQRFFDRLDGGKFKFNGPWIKYFVDAMNTAQDKKLRNIKKRRSWLRAKLKEFGLSEYSLGNVRKIDVPKFRGQPWTVDRLMSIYTGLKNDKSRAAILYGNFADAKDEQEALSWAAQCVKALTDNERAFADAVMEEYEMNYMRIQKELIDIYNDGMGHEKNYTPMKRVEINSESNLDYLDTAKILIHNPDATGNVRARQINGVGRDFSRSRVEMANDNQTPIDLGLYAIWNNQIEFQEHAIAYARPVRDLRLALSMRPEGAKQSLQQVIKNTLGKHSWRFIENYLSIAARNRTLESYDVLDGVSGWIAKNMTNAYLCANLATILKQTTSIGKFLPYCQPQYLIISLGEFMARNKKFLDECYELDPQLEDRAGNIILQSLKAGEKLGIYGKMIDAGKKPIEAVDRWTSAIGFKAVYDYNIAKGKSQEEAAREAQRAVLLTQTVTNMKDASMLYQQKGLLKLSLIFTNDLAQTFGIVAYDLAASLRGGNVPKFLYTIAGVALTATLLGYIVQGGPDDDENFAGFVGNFFTRQGIESIPLIGKAMLSLWDGNGYALLNDNPLAVPVQKLYSGVRKLAGGINTKKHKDRYGTGKVNKGSNIKDGVLDVLEGAALMGVPIPSTAIRRTKR
ncbi:MAG: hypothetical protein IJ667_05525, partial [Synergistaceae bacterium]|nr:hypothetical protein [Synergistaceae bacterium]